MVRLGEEEGVFGGELLPGDRARSSAFTLLGSGRKCEVGRGGEAERRAPSAVSCCPGVRVHLDSSVCSVMAFCLRVVHPSL